VEQKKMEGNLEWVLGVSEQGGPQPKIYIDVIVS